VATVLGLFGLNRRVDLNGLFTSLLWAVTLLSLNRLTHIKCAFHWA